MRYKEFLLQVAKDWATDKVETDAACPETSTQTPRVPHEDPLGDFRVIFGKWARDNCWK